MKIKPEDRPKMFGLLAAIGIMFCYLILVVIPSLSGAQAAPAVAQDTPGAAPNTPPAVPVTPINAPAPPAATSDNHNPIAMDAGPVPDAKNDPFLSPIPNPATAAPTAPPAILGTPQPTTPPVTTPPASAQTTPPNAPKVPLPSLMLLGVASGAEPVAVFQVGESTVEKKKGDTLPGGFTLQAIDGDGVALARGKTVSRLEVGHTITGVEE